MTASIDTLPLYTKQEEIHNSLSHFIGAIFGFASLMYFIIMGHMKGHNFIYLLPFYTYSICMMIMFFVSGYYHSRPFQSKARAVARIIDHSDIYAFVAATYFPLCIYGISNDLARSILLALQVGLCIVGIILNVIPNDSRLITVITFFIYIIQGWAIIAFYPFNIGIEFHVFLFILIGGIVYTLGSILYAIGHYKRWSHTIFHFFVLVAAILQFVGIMLLL